MKDIESISMSSEKSRRGRPPKKKIRRNSPENEVSGSGESSGGEFTGTQIVESRDLGERDGISERSEEVRFSGEVPAPRNGSKEVEMGLMEDFTTTHLAGCGDMDIKGGNGEALVREHEIRVLDREVIAGDQRDLVLKETGLREERARNGVVLPDLNENCDVRVFEETQIRGSYLDIDLNENVCSSVGLENPQKENHFSMGLDLNEVAEVPENELESVDLREEFNTKDFTVPNAEEIQCHETLIIGTNVNPNVDSNTNEPCSNSEKSPENAEMKEARINQDSVVSQGVNMRDTKNSLFVKDEPVHTVLGDNSVPTVEDVKPFNVVLEADLVGVVSVDNSFTSVVEEKTSSVSDHQHTECPIQMPSPSSRGPKRKRGENQASLAVRMLRRSARNSSGTANVSIVIPHSTAPSESMNDMMLAEAVVSDVSCITLDDEQPLENKVGGDICVDIVMRESTDEDCNVPSGLLFPPSSKSLNLDALPVLDIFSVYSCLRSFSTMLFLSPLTLEAFVNALKSSFVDTLIDSIHFSLLYALKRHMKSRAAETSNPASICLRSLNWDFLDLVTWPVYLVEYLLISGHGDVRLTFNLGKLLEGEYYRLPASMKLAVLQCLCDDFMEIEEVRIEIDRRACASELDFDNLRIANVTSSSPLVGCESDKRRKVSTRLLNSSIESKKDGISGALVEPNVSDSVTVENYKTDDWNSDECCLCKMEGDLICCDGCPAAYHSRCVGVAKDLLPEGDWYCPECEMDRLNGESFKSSSLLRGGVLLGIDPLGHAYFASFGYLLVSWACDSVSTCYCYTKDDIRPVLDVLKASEFPSNDIVDAICAHLDLAGDSVDTGGPFQSNYFEPCSDGFLLDGSSRGSTISFPCSIEDFVKQNPSKDENTFQVMNDSLHTIKGSQTLGLSESESISSSVVANSYIAHGTCSIPEGSIVDMQSLPYSSAPFDRKPASGKSDLCFEGNLNSGLANVVDENGSSECNLESGSTNQVLCATNNKLAERKQTKDLPSKRPEPHIYINCYSLGQVASSVAEELGPNCSGTIEDLTQPASDVVKRLLKVFSTTRSKFTWPSVENKIVSTEQENCGWCFTCKNANESGCFFNMDDKNALAAIDKGATGFRSKKNRRSHLTSIILYILSIEERLSGLLSGPWENSQYSKHWRKSLMKESSLMGVKRKLLSLTSNIRGIVLSGDWSKQVDSTTSLGSAYHIATILDNKASGNGVSVGRKQARKKNESVSGSDNSASKSGIMWWRGGTVSRKLFRWKQLPRSLVLKCARQAGIKKIQGITYPDSSEFAKICKNLTWRASVESETTASGLGIQVRDLDAHIKWFSITSNELFPQESGKRFRPLKKVTIRRKKVEGVNTQYLLDFGKRKVPGTVIKNGKRFEGTSGREKYWLAESHVPLKLLRTYEQKRQVRMSKNHDSKLFEKGKPQKKHSRGDGLMWILSRVQASETCKETQENNGISKCAECNKSMTVRNAVSCEVCKGYFHRRHAILSKSPKSKKAAFTCQKCNDKKSCKKNSKKGKKVGLPRVKVASLKKPLKVPKEVNQKIVKRKRKGTHWTVYKSRRHMETNHRDENSKATVNEYQIYRTQRTKVHHAFWLNGLLWTKKTNDVRIGKFTERNVLLSNPLDNSCVGPICLLCNKAYEPRLMYISCEICQDWYHGDALGITAENVTNLLGFKCYKCCKRICPQCPFSKNAEEAPLQSDCKTADLVKDCLDDGIMLNEIYKTSELVPA